MPVFEHGEVWLECQGTRMEEHGAMDEADGDGKPVKSCYVELVPGASFKICWSYDPKGAPRVDGCTACYWVDGNFVDGVDSLAVKGRLRDFSEGYPLSAHTVAPYVFQPCRILDDSSSDTDVYDEASIRCSVIPFQKTRMPYVPGFQPGEMENDEAALHPVHSTDSEVADVGYCVRYGEEVKGSHPFILPSWCCRPLPHPPALFVLFRYRTRDQLIADGLIEDEAIALMYADSSEEPNHSQHAEDSSLFSEDDDASLHVDDIPRLEAIEGLQDMLFLLLELEGIIAELGEEVDAEGGDGDEDVAEADGAEEP